MREYGLQDSHSGMNYKLITLKLEFSSKQPVHIMTQCVKSRNRRALANTNTLRLGHNGHHFADNILKLISCVKIVVS